MNSTLAGWLQVALLVKDQLVVQGAARAGAREAAVSTDDGMVRQAVFDAAPGVDGSRVDVVVECDPRSGDRAIEDEPRSRGRACSALDTFELTPEDGGYFSGVGNIAAGARYRLMIVHAVVFAEAERPHRSSSFWAIHAGHLLMLAAWLLVTSVVYVSYASKLSTEPFPPALAF